LEGIVGTEKETWGEKNKGKTKKQEGVGPCVVEETARGGSGQHSRSSSELAREGKKRFEKA